VIEAVTFDFWNTLVGEAQGAVRSARRASWSAVLVAAGHDAAPERLDAAFSAAWDAYELEWRAGRHVAPAAAAELAIDALDLELSPAARALLRAAFDEAGEQVDLRLAPGVEDVLAALGDAGVRVGIVCDVGFTSSSRLRAVLARHGVLGRFDGWAFSDEVGEYKPSPVIFRHALAALGGVDPARAAHVGDLRRTDIAGALGMGMRAVRYTGLHDDAEVGVEADHVIAHHDELRAVLGLGA